MHRYCGTNNRATRWTFTDPCKPEARPGAREESPSPAWLAAPAKELLQTGRLHTVTLCNNHVYKWENVYTCSRDLNTWGILMNFYLFIKVKSGGLH